jgi:hypothetical protein
MSWDKMCIQDISWNNTTIISYCKTLMFMEYQNIILFVWRINQSGPLQKIKLCFGIHSQLINMDLQEGMVIKDI